MDERTSMEKARNILREILVPTGLAFPVLLILGLPALLCLWLASPRSLSNYLGLLWSSFAWIGLPGRVLLNQFVPMNASLSPGIGVLAVSIVPLAFLGTLIFLLLTRRAVPKYRAVWLGFAWGLFVLQVLGTVPMTYLWAMGV